MNRWKKSYDLACMSYRMVSHIYAVFLRRDDKPTILQVPFEKELFPQILFPLLTFAFVIVLYSGATEVFCHLKPCVRKSNILPMEMLTSRVRRSKKDEIAALANQFDSAVIKIKSLRDSRQLFLRNIMHELKTPITKGKLATEMIEDATYTSMAPKMCSNAKRLF